MEKQLRAIAHVTWEGLPMICKMAGMVAFLVLGCIVTVGGANDEYLLQHQKLLPPEIWAGTRLPRASIDFLSLAQGSDQPMEITSRGVNVRSVPIGKEVIFEGNVTVKRGDETLTCDRLVMVYYEKKEANAGKGRAKRLAKDLDYLGNIKSFTASGNVKIIQNERMAVADEALYDNVKRTIRLKGGRPVLREGPDVLIGDPIFIHLDDNRIDSR
jgi:lipopolysaccharide export system protein LptA